MGGFNATPQPQQGGTISNVTYTVISDNPNVQVSFSDTGTTTITNPDAHVIARTDYSKTQTVPWEGTETGSTSVNVDEGDKYITTSTLEAPNHDTTWSVSDDSIYVNTWMVGNQLYARVANRPPILDPIGNKTVNEGELLEFTITATDPDGDILTYSVSNLPTGASFDPGTQTFSWIPDFTQAGSYYGIYFEVTDGDLADYEDIIIIVNDVTPTELIEDFIEYIESLNLQRGIENSLLSKLNRIIKLLERGQNNVAINQLNAFINEVEALRGKKLTNEQADYLIGEAEKIIYVISS
jgi:hypothetical protein